VTPRTLPRSLRLFSLPIQSRRTSGQQIVCLDSHRESCCSGSVSSVQLCGKSLFNKPKTLAYDSPSRFGWTRLAECPVISISTSRTFRTSQNSPVRWSRDTFFYFRVISCFVCPSFTPSEGLDCRFISGATLEPYLGNARKIDH
jgi:hypothetical protein